MDIGYGVHHGYEVHHGYGVYLGYGAHHGHGHTYRMKGALFQKAFYSTLGAIPRSTLYPRRIPLV